jgi:hypothetical protein
MAKNAEANGYNWYDLDPQLDFINQEMNNDMDYWFKRNTEVPSVADYKQLTDPTKAAYAFEEAFERCGAATCRMETRQNAAKEYYNLYSGSTYEGNYTPNSVSISAPNTSNVDTSSSSSTTATTSSSSSSGLGILSTILTAFSKIGNYLNGSSTDDSSSSSSSTTKSGNSNLGNSMQNAASNASSNSTTTASGTFTSNYTPATGTSNGNAKQRQLVSIAESILGKDNYADGENTSKRTQVGQGWSDCSSFAEWVYKNGLGIDIGTDTNSQINSSQLTVVDRNPGGMPDTSKLQGGDLMFYRTTATKMSQSPWNSRTDNVGHVEIYDGRGNTIGHGSGIGPKVQELTGYVNAMTNNCTQPYIETVRFKDISQYDDATSSTSSGISSSSKLSSKISTNVVGSGSGLGSKMFNRYGSTKSSSALLKYKAPKNEGAGSGIKANKPKNNSPKFKNYRGGASDIAEQSKQMLTSIQTNAQNNSTTISAELLAKLIESIAKILEKIANNTAPVNKIYEVLADYVTKSATSKAATTAAVTANAASQSKESDEIDQNISNLVATLASIAKG